jgi:hypothetical protein
VKDSSARPGGSQAWMICRPKSTYSRYLYKRHIKYIQYFAIYRIRGTSVTSTGNLRMYLDLHM